MFSFSVDRHILNKPQMYTTSGHHVDGQTLFWFFSGKTSWSIQENEHSFLMCMCICMCYYTLSCCGTTVIRMKVCTKEDVPAKVFGWHILLLSFFFWQSFNCGYCSNVLPDPRVSRAQQTFTYSSFKYSKCSVLRLKPKWSNFLLLSKKKKGEMGAYYSKQKPESK